MSLHHVHQNRSISSPQEGDGEEEYYFTCRIGNVKVLLDLLGCLVGDTSKDHQSDIIVSPEGKPV